jgi:hypothetical protein
MDAQRVEYFKQQYRLLAEEELGELLARASRNDGQLTEESVQALRAVMAERSLDAGGLLAANSAAQAADGEMRKTAGAAKPRGWRKVAGIAGIVIGLLQILIATGPGRMDGVVGGLILLVTSICLFAIPARRKD